MDISIVIATRNRDTNLKYCLNSLQNQTFTHNRFEVIVVDYGGTTDTKTIVEQYHQTNFRYIKVNEYGTFNESRAKNIGIRKSKGKYILCTNADIIFSENILDNLYQELIIYGTKHLLHLRRHELNEKFPIKNRIKYLYHGRYERYQDKISLGPKTAMGDFQVTEKKNWLTVCGYDERMQGWGAMDLDLSDRMKVRFVESLWLDPNLFKIFHQYHDWRKDRPASKYNINQILSTTGMPYLPKGKEWGQSKSYNMVQISSKKSRYWISLKKTVESNSKAIIINLRNEKASKNMVKSISIEMDNCDFCVLFKDYMLTLNNYNLIRIKIMVAIAVNLRLATIALAKKIYFTKLSRFAKKYNLKVSIIKDSKQAHVSIKKYFWATLLRGGI